MFFALSEFPSPTREPKHSGPQGMSVLCFQGVDCTSDHCHCHCLERVDDCGSSQRQDFDLECQNCGKSHWCEAPLWMDMDQRLALAAPLKSCLKLTLTPACLLAPTPWTQSPRDGPHTIVPLYCTSSIEGVCATDHRMVLECVKLRPSFFRCVAMGLSLSTPMDSSDIVTTRATKMFTTTSPHWPPTSRQRGHVEGLIIILPTL